MILLLFLLEIPELRIEIPEFRQTTFASEMMLI